MISGMFQCFREYASSFSSNFNSINIVILVSPRFFQDVIDGKLDKRPGSQFPRLPRKTSGEGHTTCACWVRRSGGPAVCFGGCQWKPGLQGRKVVTAHLLESAASSSLTISTCQPRIHSAGPCWTMLDHSVHTHVTTMIYLHSTISFSDICSSFHSIDPVWSNKTFRTNQAFRLEG